MAIVHAAILPMKSPLFLERCPMGVNLNSPLARDRHRNRYRNRFRSREIADSQGKWVFDADCDCDPDVDSDTVMIEVNAYGALPQAGMERAFGA